MHESEKSKGSRIRLFATPWTAAYQAPPPMGFSRQEYWSGLPLPSPVKRSRLGEFGKEYWKEGATEKEGKPGDSGIWEGKWERNTKSSVSICQMNERYVYAEFKYRPFWPNDLHILIQFLNTFLFNIIGVNKLLGFPDGSAGKEFTWNAEDTGSVPELGRSPGGGQGNPLQYSCLENPTDRGSWKATVQRVRKGWMWLSTHTANF